MADLGQDIYDRLVAAELAIEDETARAVWGEHVGPEIEERLVNEVFFRPAVLDKDISTPPGVPLAGARYIVGAGATGAWTGHDTDIAWWSGAAWVFETPVEGWAVWVADEDTIHVFDGSAWVALEGGSGAVSSVFGRTGAVIAQAGDYSADQIARGLSDVDADLTSLESGLNSTISDLEDHITDAVDAHDASAISKGATPNWLTGAPPAGADVETILNSIVSDLADQTGTTSDGASRIGAEATAGGLAQGSVRSQLDEVVDAISTVAGNLGGHLIDPSDAHDASAISKAAWPDWATGSPPVATDVEAGLDVIVSDLADSTGAGADGASRIGAAANGNLSEGSVRDQLDELDVMTADLDAKRPTWCTPHDTKRAAPTRSNWTTWQLPMTTPTSTPRRRLTAYCPSSQAGPRTSCARTGRGPRRVVLA